MLTMAVDNDDPMGVPKFDNVFRNTLNVVKNVDCFADENRSYAEANQHVLLTVRILSVSMKCLVFLMYDFVSSAIG